MTSAAVHTSGRTVLARAVARLAAAGVPAPAHDAAALAGQLLDLPPALVATVPTVPAAVADRLAGLVAARAGRVPLQHLLGRAGFRRLELAVGPGVFVPRPETELLVGWCLDALRAGPRHPVVVDLGAGSGAIALSVAQELPTARVHAVEADRTAFLWLQLNAAARAAVPDPPVRCHLADYADPPAELLGRVDLVAANPPYLATDPGVPVAPEVRHDPPVALWAGPDGLAGLRTVAGSAARLLRRGGLLAVEHADDQRRQVTRLLAGAGWADVRDHRDLTGRDRFTTARWPG